ncbi:Nuclear protein localization protein 4-like protein [Hypsibius exemplaris]|uniref:Nuclear protein localization protein 4 homolog n=1 Tax=Hypsibius exemplaris TaxID=2072580 RepID=A0A1W0WZS4_HYPEX|nr:Nuclear protein localization protein 4-like protein [Hypsibius exemplaris]
MASKDEKMLLRIQSADGTKRLEVSDSLTVDGLLGLIGESFDLTAASSWRLFKDRQKTLQIFSQPASIKSLGLKHGDLLYLDMSSGQRMDVDPDKAPLQMARRRGDSSFSSSVSLSALQRDGGRDRDETSNNNSITPRMSESVPNGDVVEDEVDQALWKQDGSVQRPKDERLCKHGSTGKCIYCIPIEPFDEEYLQSRSPPIKHMSFHAYLRKLTSGANKGKFAALSEVSCRIKSGCTSHLPWPEGICTKCQPSAVTLNRQRYRHIDNIMFENADLIERFLDHYRRTGLQRIGFLYGRYEQHKDVPLGIRTVVAAIYEPPQADTENGIELREDPHSEVVDCVASKMGLKRVGWIFTDLVAEDDRVGTVKYLRHKDTYFLTAEECITAAFFQSQHPNPCKLSSPSGQFGSKFVSVIVTGDQSSQIHFEGYQVSNQCMSLVRDNCLVPTYDAPELAYVKTSTSQQYVPDVFYKEKDKYGNEVTSIARPLPVEYLIVDVPAAMPKEPRYTFKPPGKGKQLFPVENRLDQIQDIGALLHYTSQFPRTHFLDAISDFHVLIFMASLETVTLNDDDLDILVAAVMSGDADIAETWAASSQFWTALNNVGANQDSSMPSTSGANSSTRQVNGASGSARAPQNAGEWTCTHCTFVNSGPVDACEMCGLPH